MFRIDRNNSIFITKGDTAEMDIRMFNKDWHHTKEPWFNKPQRMPLLPLWNSEGFIFNSEGYPVYPVDSEGRPWPIWQRMTLLTDSEGRPWYPVGFDDEDYPIYYPLPLDSEGKPILDLKTIKKFDLEMNRRPRHLYPAWSQIEEVIRKKDKVTFKVKDLATGEIVLELYNDEFVNTIYFYKEDTANLEPKQYLYQLSFEPLALADEYEMDEADKEVNTVITGLFEVVEKF